MTNSQFQIILGSGLVNLVCDEVQKQIGAVADSAPDEAEESKGSPVQRFIKMFSDIFVPIIPAIVAGGLLMGINNVLTAAMFEGGQSIIDMFPQFRDLATMINIFANAPFTFLPVLIGFSATKRFGGNPYLGAAMGMIMVHPDLLNAYSLGTGVEVPTWNLFGLTINAVGYQGTVLPVLAVSWILANIEKRLHKVTPTWLDNLTTPLLSIMISAFITFLFVGPIMRALEGRPHAILVLPDHPTPLAIRTHSGDPVPYVLYRGGGAGSGLAYTEANAAATGVFIEPGHALMDRFLAE